MGDGPKLKTVNFPTLAKEHLGKMDQDLTDFKYVAKINGVSYAVGDFAYVGRADRSLDREQQLDLHKIQVFLGTALNLLSVSEDEVEHVNISAGLPINFYKEQKNNLAEILKDLRIDTELNGKFKSFIIDEVAIYQQGVGAFISLFFNADGTPKDEKSADMNFYQFGGGIIDVGYNTCDYARIMLNNGKHSLADALSGSLEGYGATYAHEKVVELIHRDFDILKTSGECENALNHQDGILLIRGQHVDIRGYFDLGYKMLATEINKKMNKEVWRDRDTSEFASIYLTGGCASKIIEHIKIDGVEIKLQDDGIYANCKGYIARTKIDMNKKAVKEKKELTAK